MTSAWTRRRPQPVPTRSAACARSTPPTSSGRATPRSSWACAWASTPVVDERLRERHAGGWEGRTRVEIDEGWPGYLESGRRPAGYEPDDSVLARVLDALSAIATAQPGDVLVVTHGGVVRTVERHLGGDADGLIPNLGGRWLHYDGARIVLGDRVVLLDPDQVTRPQQI